MVMVCCVFFFYTTAFSQTGVDKLPNFFSLLCGDGHAVGLWLSTALNYFGFLVLSSHEVSHTPNLQRAPLRNCIKRSCCYLW